MKNQHFINVLHQSAAKSLILKRSFTKISSICKRFSTILNVEASSQVYIAIFGRITKHDLAFVYFRNMLQLSVRAYALVGAHACIKADFKVN